MEKRPEGAVEFHSRLAKQFGQKYQDRPSFQERFRVWSELIDRYSHPHDLVLDVGCGTGVLTRYAARRGRRVIGIDASPQMIEECIRQRADGDTPVIDYRLAEFSTLASGSIEKANLILCSSVLEYLPSFAYSLEVLAALLKDHGILVFSMPNTASLYRRLERCFYGITGLPRYYRLVRSIPDEHEIEQGLIAHNLQLVSRSYYAQFPFAGEILRRLLSPRWAGSLLVDVVRKVPCSPYI